MNFKAWAEPGKPADKASEAAGSPQQNGKSENPSVTIGKGADTVWGALRSQGYSNREIVERGLVDKVASLNDLKDPNLVRDGQKLSLPAGQQNGSTAGSGDASVTLGKGDTVWGALRSQGYSNREIVEQGLVDKVARTNDLKNPNLVQPGQKLSIPGRQGANPSRPTTTATQPGTNQRKPTGSSTQSRSTPTPAQTTPDKGEAKPAPAPTTPDKGEAKPAPAQPTPDKGEAKPAPAQPTPDKGEAKPAPAQTTPDKVDAKPAPAQPGPVNLAPGDMSTADKYKYYSDLIKANGGTMNPDGATVLGLRGLATDGSRRDSNVYSGGYNDSFIVLNKDGKGNPQVTTLGGATHPGQTRSSLAVDRNGTRAVGMIRPGHYQARYSGTKYGSPKYHVQTQAGDGSIPGWRDTSSAGKPRNQGDWTVSDAERSASENRGDKLTGVLFHNGRFTSKPSSIGCQTLSPRDYGKFTKALGGSSFNYTLLDANKARGPGSGTPSDGKPISADKPKAGAPDQSGSDKTKTAGSAFSLGPGEVLKRGAEGDKVRQLQETLNQRGAKLDVDGKLGPKTEAAIRDFQSKAGIGVDGKVGPNTLRELGGKVDTTGQAPATGRHVPQIGQTALRAAPGQMVTVSSNGRTFKMRSETARALNKLTKLIQNEFPGTPVRLTSTTGGRHSSGHHGSGTAVDFALSNTPGAHLPDRMTQRVAALAKQAGFRSVLNEYIHDSRYKTGPHIHAASPS